jgi:hypothetical protein
MSSMGVLESDIDTYNLCGQRQTTYLFSLKPPGNRDGQIESNLIAFILGFRQEDPGKVPDAFMLHVVGGCHHHLLRSTQQMLSER